MSARMKALAGTGLFAWWGLWVATYAIGGGISWHYFVRGQSALADLDNPVVGGVHLYAGLPELQIGPIALGTAWLLSPAGPQVSLLLAQSLGAAAGVVILLLAHATAREVRPDLEPALLHRRTAVTAVVFAPVWLYLAVASTHLDDVLALLFGVAGVHAAVRQRAVWAGLLLGLATDAKPWALPFVAILLVLDRGRTRALVCCLAAVTAAWMPFLLGDVNTLNAVHFTIPNTPRTALRVLGVDTPRTPPWDRPAQALLGLALAAVAVRWRRWPAVILVVVAARLVLDPGTNIYYSAGAVVGAALWDIVGARTHIPVWTIGTAAALFSSRWVPLPDPAHGWATLLFFVACVGLLAVAWPRLSPRRPPGG